MSEDNWHKDMGDKLLLADRIKELEAELEASRKENECANSVIWEQNKQMIQLQAIIDGPIQTLTITGAPAPTQEGSNEAVDINELFGKHFGPNMKNPYVSAAIRLIKENGLTLFKTSNNKDNG